MDDGAGLAEALLGSDGFKVIGGRRLWVGELTVTVETAVVAGCGVCWVRAEAQDRRPVTYRDLECFERPVGLVWRKRRWRS